MACLSPIWIQNRRYYNQPEDYAASQLLLHPEDVVRQRILVPCGHCVECLKAERNDWFVRLNQEYAYQKKMNRPSWFFTLTIAPKNYAAALVSPSAYVRRFFEKIRHDYGVKIKHALFQEFSPVRGRLHFHGVLFASELRYTDLHEVAKDFGFIYLRPVNSRSLRYVVKYIVKDIDACAGDGRLLAKKYRRKFVSPGVGKYLGNMPAPSFDCRVWRYSNVATGISYSYRIPRYYDRFLCEKELRKRQTYSAFLVAQAGCTDFQARIVLEALQESFGDDWRKHVSDNSLRRYVWAQEIIKSYRKAYNQTSSSQALASVDFAAALVSFENFVNSPPN